MAYIEWKGKRSNTIPGLIICELPPISKPKMRTSITKIDGRDGDIIEELGYESYTKNVKIGLTRNYDIDTVAKYFTGEGTIVFSDESNRVYNSKIIDKIDYNKLLHFKTATVKFHTQPFKYLKDEKPAELTTSSETSLIVKNLGLEKSKPIITLKGSGTVELIINNNSILTYNFPEEESSVVIDSIQEEAYLDGIFKNRNMLGIFPILEPGDNVITWSGNLTQIIVEPKSRWI